MAEKTRIAIKDRWHYFIHDPVTSFVLVLVIPVAISIVSAFIEPQFSAEERFAIELGTRMTICGVLAGIAMPLAIMTIERLAFYKDAISIRSVLGHTRIIALFGLLINDFFISLFCGSGIYIIGLSLYTIIFVGFSYMKIVNIFSNSSPFISYRRYFIKSVLFRFFTKPKYKWAQLTLLEDFLARRTEEAERAIKDDSQTKLRDAITDICAILNDYLEFRRRYVKILLKHADDNDFIKHSIDLTIANSISSIATSLEETDPGRAEIFGIIHTYIQAMAKSAAEHDRMATATLLYDSNTRVYHAIIQKGSRAIAGRPIASLATVLTRDSISQAKKFVTDLIERTGENTVNTEILLCQKSLRELYILAYHHRYKDFIDMLSILARLADSGVISSPVILEITTTLAFVDTKQMDKSAKTEFTKLAKKLLSVVKAKDLENSLSSRNGKFITNMRLEFIKSINGETIENEGLLLGDKETKQIKQFIRKHAARK